MFGMAIYLPSCKKEATLPIVTAYKVSDITETTASTGGTVKYDGGAEVTDIGVCWSTIQNPTADNIKTMNKTYSGIFTSNLAGLTPGKTYFVRAYAIYDNGPTIYGNELSFATSIEQGTGKRKADYTGEALYDLSGFSIGSSNLS